MPLERTLAPVLTSVDLAEIKDHLRVTDSDLDNYLESLVTAAEGFVEAWLNKSLLPQTWTYTFDVWPQGDRVWLPMPPFVSITSVKYIDTLGAQQTISAADYTTVGTDPAILMPAYNKNWPGHRDQVGAIEVVYKAGMECEDIPEPIKLAVKIVVADMYNQPETTYFNTNVFRTNFLERILASHRNYGTPGYGTLNASHRVS
jgi:uncharacterized phiE125 gp8 family phage protein